MLDTHEYSFFSSFFESVFQLPLRHILCGMIFFLAMNNHGLSCLKILGKKFREFFKGKVDEASIEQLEQLFYEADLGVETSHELTEIVRKLYQKQERKKFSMRSKRNSSKI